MNTLKSIILITYYLIVTISIIYFNSKIKSKTGKKVGGSIDIKKIPKSIIWLPILATASMLFIIVFPFFQLFMNEFYKILFPLYFLNNFITFIIAMVLIPGGLIILVTSQIQLGNSYRILLSNEKAALKTTRSKRKRLMYSLTDSPTIPRKTR